MRRRVRSTRNPHRQHLLSDTANSLLIRRSLVRAQVGEPVNTRASRLAPAGFLSSRSWLVDHLVASERSFIKGLRYNMAPTDALASATLIDVGEEGIPLFVQSREGGEARPRASTSDIASPLGPPAWVWLPLREAMPPIPKTAPARSTSAVAI